MASRRGSGTWAKTAWGAACDQAPKTSVTIAPGVDRQVHAQAVEAFEALADVIAAHGYAVRSGDTGAYNCRVVTGGSSPSLHSWPIAIDVNWNTNPFRSNGPCVTDLPKALVDNVLRIRTKKGVAVWEWGGGWTRPKDAMHFGIIATRTELGAGINWETVRQSARDPKRPGTWPTLRKNSRGPTVEKLQRRLKRAGQDLAVDGDFGPKTHAAVVAFQKARGLTPDGIVGLQTWTALLSKQPPLETGEPSPVKRTDASAKAKTRPRLVRRPDEEAVYLVAEGVLVLVPSPEAFKAMKFRKGDVKKTAADDPVWHLPGYRQPA